MTDAYEITDYATGVEGTFCIGRKEGAFMSYWNPGGWAGSGYVFHDRRIAEVVMRAESSSSSCRELADRLKEAYDFYMGPNACGNFTCNCGDCGICEIRIVTETALSNYAATKEK